MSNEIQTLDNFSTCRLPINHQYLVRVGQTVWRGQVPGGVLLPWHLINHHLRRKKTLKRSVNNNFVVQRPATSQPAAGPDSSVIRVSAGEVGCRFAPRLCQTKGYIMGMTVPLLMLTTKGSARKIQEGR